MNIFGLAGSAQQAQQSTHLAEGLNPSSTYIPPFKFKKSLQKVFVGLPL